MYVAIDKFTKWPELEAERKVTTQPAVKFYKGQVCHFSVPNRVKLKCIPRKEGLELWAEIHGGICGSHIGSRALLERRSGKVCSGPPPSRMRQH